MTGRQKAAAFFIVLGSCLVAATITLNVGWVLLHWRRVVPMVVGIILFALIIAGFVIYTIFLVRELRRNEQHEGFINAVTHELKTPIASIKLYLETLQSRDVTDAQRKQFYQIMMADADRLHYTVDQVLKAGVAGQKRKEGGALVSVDVHALVSEAAEIARARHHLSEEQLKFAVAADAEAAYTLGDPDELLTATLNLMDNAVKYSAERVAIEVEVTSPHRDHILVSVRDHGLGIPRNQLELIFDRFYRVPERTKMSVALAKSSPTVQGAAENLAKRAKVKGTGLGLYIVRQIVKKHGGRVWAESPGEGKGSTFVMELPRAN